MGPPGPKYPFRQSEEENIDLYFSIQVSQARKPDGNPKAGPQPKRRWPDASTHIRISIKNAFREDFELPISTSMVVGIVKSKIRQKTGIPKLGQRLIFAGEELEDSYSLAYYKVHRNDTLYLVENMVSKSSESDEKKQAYIWQCVSPWSSRIRWKRAV
jgi:hypothetical protein